MKKAQNILIAGFGDIGRRVARQLRGSQRYRMTALIRRSTRSSTARISARLLGVQFVRGDLGNPRSLQRLIPHTDTVLYFAPPPGSGNYDTHTKNLLAALSGVDPRRLRAAPMKRRMLPRQIIYISTTGVYGDCKGEWIDETRPLRPQSARAKRRVHAERQLRAWGLENCVDITVLRAPGIYAEDRLPVDRLRRQTPVLMADEDVFTNHIHADDLARAAINAMRQRWPKQFRVFNVVDDSQLRMGDYLDQVADAFGLQRPPRIGFADAAKHISPMLLSFMRESRRISNARIKREMKFVFKYPTSASVLSNVRTGVGDGTG
jgi:nucleoside-diphosphate-sugar epimerase